MSTSPDSRSQWQVGHRLQGCQQIGRERFPMWPCEWAGRALQREEPFSPLEEVASGSFLPYTNGANTNPRPSGSRYETAPVAAQYGCDSTGSMPASPRRL